MGLGRLIEYQDFRGKKFFINSFLWQKFSPSKTYATWGRFRCFFTDKTFNSVFYVKKFTLCIFDQ